MTPVSLQQRAIEWKKLSSLLSTYERLYDTEQAYLLEVMYIYFTQYIKLAPKSKLTSHYSQLHITYLRIILYSSYDTKLVYYQLLIAIDMKQSYFNKAFSLQWLKVMK